MRRIAPFLLIALLVPAAPAAAHWSTKEMTTSVAGARDAVVVPRDAGAALLPLSDTFCGTETTSDETAGDTTLPHFKVIYAYPTDAVNRFSTRKDLIESKMKQANVAMNAASLGRRELRIDTETGSCGRYVDIMTVALPHNAEYYGPDSNGTAGTALARLEDDIGAKLAPTAVTRNYVVWADMGCTSSVTGSSYCAGGIARTGFTFGPRLAIVWGNNNPPPSTFGNFSSSTFDIVAVLHEMLHTVGAVSGLAPHVTKNAGGSSLGHCWQEDDLMCQPEGVTPVSNDCPNLGGDDSLVVDCGQDDYFNVDPPPGSFLANSTFANTANSSFMIGPPRAALMLSATTANAGDTVTLDASKSTDDNLDKASFGWDFEGDGTIDATTPASKTTHVYSAGGTFAPAVTVVDAEDMRNTTSASLTVAGPPAPGPTPGPVATPAKASSLALSPGTFRAATTGASVAAAKKPPIGSTVRYRLDKASGVTFTVSQLVPGKLKGKSCVKPTAALRKAKSCTLVVALKGSFAQSGKAGQNSLKFTGRLGGKALKPGSYRLLATPAPAGAAKATPVSAAFKISR